MKITLAKIESQLKAFVEDRLNVFQDSKTKQEIEELTELILDSIVDKSNNSLEIPKSISIVVNPNKEHFWKAQNAFFNTLSKMLDELQYDADIENKLSPIISILTDPDLLENDIIINTSPQSHFRRDTVSIKPQKDMKKGQSVFPASLITPNGQVYSLQQIRTHIGRKEINDIIINDSRVSRQHALILKEDNHHIIIDLESTGGILVNNKHIKKAILNNNDVISLGGFELTYKSYSNKTLDHTLPILVKE